MEDYHEFVDASIKPDQLAEKVHSGYKIVDVRPENEAAVIRPHGSMNLPYVSEREYRRDQGKSLRSKIVKATHGKREEFLSRAKGSIRLHDMPTIIACGDGLVSMVATKQLRDAGYTNVHWLVGGLASVPEGVLQNEGTGSHLGYGVSVAGTVMDAIAAAEHAIDLLKTKSPQATEASFRALEHLQASLESSTPVVRAQAAKASEKLINHLKQNGPMYEEKSKQALEALKEKAPEMGQFVLGFMQFLKDRVDQAQRELEASEKTAEQRDEGSPLLITEAASVMSDDASSPVLISEASVMEDDAPPMLIAEASVLPDQVKTATHDGKRDGNNRILLWIVALIAPILAWLAGLWSCIKHGGKRRPGLGMA